MDYIMVRAWGEYMGSMAYYIRDMLATAKEDNAPGNAIYKRDDGTWATIEDVVGPARVSVERIAGRIQGNENPQHPLLPPRRIT